MKKGLIAATGLMFAAEAVALPIDLSAFAIVDPTVTVFGLDKNSASFTEDAVTNPVTLLDFDLPIPADAQSLTFAYELVVGAGNDDYFDFFFDDLAFPSDSFGGTEGTYSGSLTKDLTGFAGGTLGIAFTLFANDFDLDSNLTISNVQITQGPLLPVPPAWALLGAGLMILSVTRSGRGVR